MTKQQTALRRISRAAADKQQETREMGPRGYQDPKTRPVILANRIYRRRYLHA